MVRKGTHTMRKPYALALTLSALLLLGAACTKKTEVNTNTGSENENLAVENENASVSNINRAVNVNEDRNANENENSNSNTNESRNSNVNGSGTESSAVTNGTLSVTKPERNEDVDSPFNVQGIASGDTVYVRVKNAAGTTVFTEPVTVRNGAFSVNLTYEFINTTSGSVEVFQKDAAGTETNLVTVPLTYKVESASNSNDNSNTNESADANSNDNGNSNTND